MNLQQATLLFRCEFPEFDWIRADKKPCFVRREAFLGETYLDEYAVAGGVAKLLAERQNARVQAVFNALETILTDADPNVRDWGCAFLRALQDVAGWRTSGQEAFVGFLLPETHRAWSALEAIQTDLADCSILEEEITMWRVVHHATGLSTAC